MIDTLLDRAQHIPIWILSFGNAVASLDELESKMIRRGRQTKAIAIRYQHLASVATEEKNESNREYLFPAWFHFLGYSEQTSSAKRFRACRRGSCK